jgi:hypothetical protein
VALSIIDAISTMAYLSSCFSVEEADAYNIQSNHASYLPGDLWSLRLNRLLLIWLAMTIAVISLHKFIFQKQQFIFFFGFHLILYFIYILIVVVTVDFLFMIDHSSHLKY